MTSLLGDRVGSPEGGVGDGFRGIDEGFRRRDDDDDGESLVLEDPGNVFASTWGRVFDEDEVLGIRDDFIGGAGGVRGDVNRLSSWAS